MKTISFKVPHDLDIRLKLRAKEIGSSKSEFIRETLVRELRPKRGRRERGPTFLELAGDLIGSVKGGPRDLASNKKYMKNFGLPRATPHGRRRK